MNDYIDRVTGKPATVYTPPEDRIPAQRLGSDTCAHCDEPVHLVNRALGPEWVHDRDDLPWCPLRAAPAGRPWPKEAP
jgi:hypothetical protein